MATTSKDKLGAERARLAQEMSDVDTQLNRVMAAEQQAQARTHLEQARLLLAQAEALDTQAREEAQAQEQAARAARKAELTQALDTAQNQFADAIRRGLQALVLTGYPLTPAETQVSKGLDSKDSVIRAMTWRQMPERIGTELGSLRRQITRLSQELNRV